VSRERIMLSTDPKDPLYRLRVEDRREDQGLFEIAEENITSRSPTAQVLADNDRPTLWLIGEEAAFVRDALIDLLGGEQHTALALLLGEVADAYEAVAVLWQPGEQSRVHADALLARVRAALAGTTKE
jgi:hypothetical protein